MGRRRLAEGRSEGHARAEEVGRRIGLADREQVRSAGSRGEIHAVIGRDADVRRLAELGWQTGAQIQVVNPGSPCIAEIAGQRLCFRSGDGLEVLIRTDAAA